MFSKPLQFILTLWPVDLISKTSLYIQGQFQWMGRLLVSGVKDLFHERALYHATKFQIILLNLGASGTEKLYIHLRAALPRWFKRLKHGQRISLVRLICNPNPVAMCYIMNRLVQSRPVFNRIVVPLL